MTRARIPSATYFFLVGLIYYFVVPWVALQFFSENYLVSAASLYFDDKLFDGYYVLDILLIAFSWYFGYRLAIFFFASPCVHTDLSYADAKECNVVSVVLLIILGLYFLLAIQSGVGFFSGYSAYNVQILGGFSTHLYVTTFFILYFDCKNKKVLYLNYLISALLLLGLGSRMFFTMTAISLVLRRISIKPKMLRNPILYVVALFLFMLVLWVGSWRQGEGGGLIGVLFAEPLFTLVSAAEYISNHGGRPIIGNLSEVFAGLVNFIPSVIFPDKLEFLRVLTEDDAKNSPFGGSSLLVGLYSNFGFAYPLFLFLIGWISGFARVRAQANRFLRAFYFISIPLFVFYFFRDGFVTFIKVYLFNSLILPFFLIFAARVLLASIRRS